MVPAGDTNGRIKHSPPRGARCSCAQIAFFYSSSPCLAKGSGWTVHSFQRGAHTFVRLPSKLHPPCSFPCARERSKQPLCCFCLAHSRSKPKILINLPTTLAQVLPQTLSGRLNNGTRYAVVTWKRALDGLKSFSKHQDGITWKTHA